MSANYHDMKITYIYNFQIWKDRIISVGNDFSLFEWKKAIDWDSINHLKKMYEDKSIGFLREQLNC